jgi:hypothetical protein
MTPLLYKQPARQGIATDALAEALIHLKNKGPIAPAKKAKPRETAPDVWHIDSNKSNV